MLSLTPSTNRWATEPPMDAGFDPPGPANDWSPRRRPPFAKRVLVAFDRFSIAFCLGVGATLAWLSFGDAARETIAGSNPQLAWLAPQTAFIARTAPDMIVPAAPADPSLDLEQLKAGLAVVRQSVDQLAASQEQMTRDITKLQATEQDILYKVSAPPPPPAPTAPTRKPVSLAPAQQGPAAQAQPAR